MAHPHKPVNASVERLDRWAGEHGVALLACDADRDRVGHGVPTVPDLQFAAQVDAVVSLGGDGTMLGAMRLVSTRPVPVLGVNYGNRGFLIELSPDELDAAMRRLVNGDFSVEAHLGLRVTGVGPDPRTGQPPMAFNDVVLTSRHSVGTTSVDLRVNDEQYGYYRCDALIVSTPTGSTAYNYAAGGPVLSPSAPAVVITPVAPMAGIGRSVVLGIDDEVVLHVGDDGTPVDVDIDGAPAGGISPEQTVTITAVAEAAQVVRLDSGTHARRSRVRLSLLDLPLRPDQLRELFPGDPRERWRGDTD